MADTDGAQNIDVHVPIVVVGAARRRTVELAAADGGAEVVVLERDATPSGTTSMAQGFVCAAGSKAQRAVGVEDAPDAFLADIMAKTRGATDAGLADHRGPGGADDRLADGAPRPTVQRRTRLAR